MLVYLNVVDTSRMPHTDSAIFLTLVTYLDAMKMPLFNYPTSSTTRVYVPASSESSDDVSTELNSSSSKSPTEPLSVTSSAATGQTLYSKVHNRLVRAANYQKKKRLVDNSFLNTQ